MIGCWLVGALAVVAIVKVAKMRWRLAHAYGYGPGFGCGGGGFRHGWHGHDDGDFEGHGWGRRGGGRGGWRGFGPRAFLRGVFERLDTTPGQEKAIRAAIDELRAKARSTREELKDARPEVARAFRSDVFDETSVGGAVAHLESATDSMRKALIDAFAKIHEALDERQRGIVADFLEKRSFGGFGGGPYRGNEWM